MEDVFRRFVRTLLAGILSFSHICALSQAHAESAAASKKRRPAAVGASKTANTRPLLAQAGNRVPIDGPRLNRFFDRSPRRKILREPTAPAVRSVSDGKKRAPLALRTLKNTRHPLIVPNPIVPRAYRRTFRILLRNPEKTDRYDNLILKHARKFKLDPRLLKAIIAAESEFNKNALSPAGAIGLMQLMPRTAEGLGVPRSMLRDPESNIRAGAAYLAHLFSRAWKSFKLKGLSYRDAPIWIVRRIIAAYNAGPKFLYRKRWYRQTRRYVKKVILFYQSRVTDIRRLPARENSLPAFSLISASTGVYN